MEHVPHSRSPSSPRSSSSPPAELHGERGGERGGAGVMTSSLSHHIGRHIDRLHVKTAVTADPAELMEQWNPSPPWSDTTVQRVPDLSHQELSPYVTATPPTPTGTPGYSAPGCVSHQPTYSAFSFDLTPEQYVPNVLPAGAARSGPLSDVPAEDLWTERRLFPLHPPPLSRGVGVILAAPPRADETQLRSPATGEPDGRSRA